MISELGLNSLSKGFLCEGCVGTGADLEKTKQVRKESGDNKCIITCWTCSGNGLDPSKYMKDG